MTRLVACTLTALTTIATTSLALAGALDFRHDAVPYGKVAALGIQETTKSAFVRLDNEDWDPGLFKWGNAQKDKHHFFAFDHTTETGKAMYSFLLAAYVSGKDVRLIGLNGDTLASCYDGYPRLARVDNMDRPAKPTN